MMNENLENSKLNCNFQSATKIALAPTQDIIKFNIFRMV